MISIGRHGRPPRHRWRRVLWRGQGDRRISSVKVRDAVQLGDRVSRDLHRSAPDDDVAVPGRLAQRLELGHDRAHRATRHISRTLPDVMADGHERQSDTGDQLLEGGRGAQPGLVADCTQVQRQRQHGLNISTRSNRGERHPHSQSPSIVSACRPVARLRPVASAPIVWQ